MPGTETVFRVIDIRRKINERDAVIVARILCNPGLCAVKGNCSACIAEAERGWEKRIKEAQFRKKVEDAGGHHLHGGWEVPVVG